MVELPEEISEIVENPIFIGSGAQGTIWKVTKKTGVNLGDSDVYALKILKAVTPDARKKIIERLQLISEIRSPCITNLHFYSAVGDNVYVVMDYCPKGTLLKVINDADCEGRLIPEEDIWRYFTQICIGLASLHLNDIVHRDIKPENILFYADNHLKLADFDLCYGHEHSTNVVGTSHFFSPRACNLNRKDPQTKESDIWALGCVLYYLCNLKDPFDGNVHKIQNERHKPIREGYPNEMKFFLDWCLQKKRTARPTIFDILTNEFIIRKARYLDIDISKWETEAIKKLDAEKISVLTIDKWASYSVDILNWLFKEIALNQKISGLIPKDKCYLIVEVSNICNLSINDFPALIPNTISEIRDIIEKLIEKSYKHFTFEIKYCIVKLRSDLSIKQFGFIWFIKTKTILAIESEIYYAKNVYIITQKMFKQDTSHIITDLFVKNKKPWLYILSMDGELPVGRKFPSELLSRILTIIEELIPQNENNLGKIMKTINCLGKKNDLKDIVGFTGLLKNLRFTFNSCVIQFSQVEDLLSCLISDILQEPIQWMLISKEIIKAARMFFYLAWSNSTSIQDLGSYRTNKIDRIAKNIEKRALKSIECGLPENGALNELKRMNYAIELMKTFGNRRGLESDRIQNLLFYLSNKNLDAASELQISLGYFICHSNHSINSFALDCISYWSKMSNSYDMLYRFLLTHKESDWELLYGILDEIETVILDDSVDLTIRDKFLKGENDENPGFLYFADFNKYKVRNNWRIREKVASGLVKISKCNNDLLREVARIKLEERMKRETNKKVVYVFEHQDYFITSQKNFENWREEPADPIDEDNSELSSDSIDEFNWESSVDPYYE